MSLPGRLASSHPLVFRALETVLQLCQELGIVVNWEESSLTPAQRVVYLGVILVSTLFRASTSQPRVEKLCSTVEEFLSYDRQPASLWRRLLGILSSLTAIIPGGRLRMRSLQLRLHFLWIGRFLHDSIESGVSPGPGMVDKRWIVFSRAFLWLRSTPPLTFGPTPRTWGGELIFRM